MITMFTLACVKCHCGWQSPANADRCPHCHEAGTVRGSVLIFELTKPDD